VDGETMASNRIFDRAAALDRVEGDVELLMELIELFFEQAPGLMAEIDQSIESVNARTLTAAAHSLKGSAGNLGGSDAYDTANRLEQLAKEGDLANASALAAKLQQDVLILTSALAVYRQELTG
jgi:HPt (histidine-containing phosphotransfer) domain-containing protein